PPAGVKPKPAGPALPKELAVKELVDAELAAPEALAMRFPVPTPGPTVAPIEPPSIPDAIPSAAPSAPAPRAATTPQQDGGPPKGKQWIGYLALLVCAAALYLAQQAENRTKR